MQTPGGEWRVEAVRRGTSRWFRILHELPHDNQDRHPLVVHRGRAAHLGEAGVDIGLLGEADTAA